MRHRGRSVKKIQLCVNVWQMWPKVHEVINCTSSEFLIVQADPPPSPAFPSPPPLNPNFLLEPHYCGRCRSIGLLLPANISTVNKAHFAGQQLRQFAGISLCAAALLLLKALTLAWIVGLRRQEPSNLPASPPKWRSHGRTGGVSQSKQVSEMTHGRSHRNLNWLKVALNLVVFSVKRHISLRAL